MNLVPLKLLTIVAESVLAEQLTTELKALGATGYTLTDARGQGSRHLRAGEQPSENVKIESVVSETVAQRTLEHLSKNYFPNYAILAYVAEVHTVRGEKYV